jgi:hypothetical protein
MAQPSPFISNAKTLDEIASLFNKEYGTTPSQIFETGKVKVAVFLPDVASGLSLREIVIYVHNEDHTWSLVLTRSTHTSQVSIDFDKSSGLLTFKSKAGKLLMTVPADSLALGSVGGQVDWSEQ